MSDSYDPIQLRAEIDRLRDMLDDRVGEILRLREIITSTPEAAERNNEEVPTD